MCNFLSLPAITSLGAYSLQTNLQKNTSMRKRRLPSLTLIGPAQLKLYYRRPLLQQMVSILSASDAVNWLRDHVIDGDQIDLKEFFWVLLLTRSNRLLGHTTLAMGGSSGVVVDIKELFQLVLLSNAKGLIVTHNHPSGSLTASPSDKAITRKIAKVAKLFDIHLLDHIIITSESYLSFVEGGLL